MSMVDVPICVFHSVLSDECLLQFYIHLDYFFSYLIHLNGLSIAKSFLLQWTVRC